MSTLSSRVGLRASTTTLASFRKHAKQSVVNPHSSNFNSRRKSLLVSNGATISFVRDSVETSVPDVKLTKSRDGTSGTAFFTFENPDVFESATGDITGMYLSDEEGEMTTVSSCCLLYHLIARDVFRILKRQTSSLPRLTHHHRLVFSMFPSSSLFLSLSLNPHSSLTNKLYLTLIYV
jgi:hypothetical protein